MASKTLNLGLIGAGRIGSVHAENLTHRAPMANLVAVADIDEAAAREVATRCDIPQVYRDYRRILKDDTVEAVLICSSTHTHVEMIEAAAQAGKPIFCEKPIARDLAAIDRALEAVDRAGVKLQIGFNRRFDANFKRIRDMVAAGELGEPHLLRITSRDPEPPPISYVQVSGGIYLDMTIHDFDMARYLVGAEVEEIYAMGNVLVDPAIGRAGDVDTTIITLRFDNGVLGTIDNSRQAVYGYDQRVEVFGSKGMALAENETIDRVTRTDATGEHGPQPLYFFVERYLDAYLAELQDFIGCVLEDKTPSVTGQDGRIAVVMACAAQKSQEQGRSVRLDEIS